MFKKLHSGYAQLPLLGEIAFDCNSVSRGRHWIDISLHGWTVELFLGSTNIAWSRTRCTMPVMSFLTGWCLTPPLSLLGLA
jgi:hypothetical protein